MTDRTRIVVRTCCRLVAVTFAQFALGAILAVDDALADFGGDDS
jgi:hypothetical protein